MSADPCIRLVEKVEMPNYCSNAVLIRGPEESLRRLYDDCGGSFAFSAFFPLPAELKGTSAKLDPLGDILRSVDAFTGGPLGADPEPTDWFQWQMANWGNKWDVNEALDEGEIAAGCVEVRFSTAWRPPDKFCKKLSEKYPDLEVEFAFAEGAMGFYGVGTFRTGATEDEYRTIKVGSEQGFAIDRLPGVQGEFWAEKPEDMDEDEWDDMDEEDRLTPACSEHLDKYGLGTGG
jgi:hypothetical protein